MKKSIFCLLIVLFGLVFSVHAAKQESKVKLVRSPVLADLSFTDHFSTELFSSLDTDSEKIQIAEGISIYKDLKKNDLGKLRKLLSVILWKAVQRRDYRLIIDVCAKIARVDRGDKYTLINQSTIRRCAVKAYIDEKKELLAKAFLAHFKTIQVRKEEETGLFLVDKCCDSNSMDIHLHTIFYYEYRCGDLIFVKQITQRSIAGLRMPSKDPKVLIFLQRLMEEL